MKKTLVLVLSLSMACMAFAAAADMNTATVQFNAQNDSGETGTATLSDQADGLHVVLNIANAPAGIAQPAHIHQGTCAALDKAPKWPLKPVVDGKSETVIPNLTLADVSGGKYAINVHKSADDIPHYVACGDIK
jgi:hypothetical protein